MIFSLTYFSIFIPNVWMKSLLISIMINYQLQSHIWPQGSMNFRGGEACDWLFENLVHNYLKVYLLHVSNTNNISSFFAQNIDYN